VTKNIYVTLVGDLITSEKMNIHWLSNVRSIN